MSATTTATTNTAAGVVGTLGVKIKDAISAFLDDEEEENNNQRFYYENDFENYAGGDNDEIQGAGTNSGLTGMSTGQSIKQINELLEIYGYPSPMPFGAIAELLASKKAEGEEATKYNVDTVLTPILQCINCILMQRQKDIDLQYELNETMRRLRSDNDALQSKMEFYNERVASAERDYHAAVARERSVEEKFRLSRQRWEKEKEELSKQITQLTNRDTQYLHEIRKKEREYEKLKAKLQSALTGERQRASSSGGTVIDISKGVAISNAPIPSANTAAAARDAARRLSMFTKPGTQQGSSVTPASQSGFAAVKNQQEMLYKNAVKRYEEQIAVLTIENEELREAIKSLSQTIKDLLKELNPTQQVPEIDVDASAIGSQFELPIHLMRQHLAELSNSINALKAFIEASVQNSKNSINEDVVKGLEYQLDQCKKTIEEQEQIIQYSLAVQQSGKESSKINLVEDSMIEGLRRDFEDEMALFEAQKKTFEIEKKRVLDATIKLAKERAEFEEQRKLLLQLIQGDSSLNNIN